MTDKIEMNDLVLLPNITESIWNRAEGDSSNWQFQTIVMRQGEPDKSGVMVDVPYTRIDADGVFPLNVDHGIKGDATRYGWAYYRTDGVQGWFEGTLPDTTQTRDFIARIEHDQTYGKASASVGVKYNRADLRMPSAELRAKGTRLVMPKARIDHVAYTNTPRLDTATFDLLRSLDDSDIIDTAETAIRMVEEDKQYQMSAALKEVVERRKEDGTL